jgi:methylated-DNA-protein-cysteine methyltransferase-like protein
MANDFYQQVYEVVCLIPEGRVSSYGAIAKYLGTAKSSRLVGYAMGQSHGTHVPAHRVVNRNGLLTGRHHFNPPELMQILLEAEGVQIVEHQIAKFDELFWDPNEEIAA